MDKGCPGSVPRNTRPPLRLAKMCLKSIHTPDNTILENRAWSDSCSKPGCLTHRPPKKHRYIEFCRPLLEFTEFGWSAAEDGIQVASGRLTNKLGRAKAMGHTNHAELLQKRPAGQPGIDLTSQPARQQTKPVTSNVHTQGIQLTRTAESSPTPTRAPSCDTVYSSSRKGR